MFYVFHWYFKTIVTCNWGLVYDSLSKKNFKKIIKILIMYVYVCILYVKYLELSYINNLWKPFFNLMLILSIDREIKYIILFMTIRKYRYNHKITWIIDTIIYFHPLLKMKHVINLTKINKNDVRLSFLTCKKTNRSSESECGNDSAPAHRI